MGHRTAAVHAALLLALMGCSPASDSTSGEAASDSVAGQVEDDLEAAGDSPAPVLRDLRLAIEGSQEPEFAHDPHRDIACRACHGTVTGHDTHRDIACSECHETPAFPEQASVPTAAECLACHHDPVRAEPCGRCHGLPADLPVAVVPVRVVAAGPATGRVRALDFRHELHAGVACEACHGTPPTAAAARDCAACHAEHHEPTRRCIACHAPLPLDTHSFDAHRGCGGSGCHDDAAVLSLPPTRAVCLACHQDQTAHEPGRECGPCHRIAEASAVRLEDGSGS